MVRARGQIDVFPTTKRTLMGRLLAGHPAGAAEAGRLVMSVYRRPLTVYLRGSGIRGLGEAEEVVEGFFADRLARQEFLADWLRSGHRFRYWLVRAFRNYLMEQFRTAKRWREGPRRALSAGWSAPADEGPEALYHQEAALEIVRRALRLAEEQCARSGQEDHWQVFIRHVLDGQDYSTIGRSLGVTAVRAGVMARTAGNRAKQTLRELIAWEGTDDNDVDREIRALMEVLET